MILARSGVAVPATGVGLELDALAACVLAVWAWLGDGGKVVNVVAGVLVLGLIGNIMNLLSVPVYPQPDYQGCDYHRGGADQRHKEKMMTRVRLNTVNKEKKWNAENMKSYFTGIISDWIFPNVSLKAEFEDKQCWKGAMSAGFKTDKDGNYYLSVPRLVTWDSLLQSTRSKL